MSRAGPSSAGQCYSGASGPYFNRSTDSVHLPPAPLPPFARAVHNPFVDQLVGGYYGSDDRFSAVASPPALRRNSALPTHGAGLLYQPAAAAAGFSSPGRRHSSYSHENILQMKFQPMPQIDPRYRDSRPFVSSASNIYEYNGRRDFFARRRSSSSLQDDVMQTFQSFQSVATRPSVPCGSSGSVHRWQLPTATTTTTNSSNNSLNDNGRLSAPAIFVEEFDDAKLAEQRRIEDERQQQQQQQRAAAQSTTSLSSAQSVFDLADEIPFIDDDDCDEAHNVAESARPEAPIYIPQAMQCRNYAKPAAAAKATALKQRKTVSFDLVEHQPDDGSPCAPSNTCPVNKSHTYDGLSACPPPFGEPLWRDVAPTGGDPPAFGLDLHSPLGASDDSDEQDFIGGDELSAYFDSDGFANLSQSQRRRQTTSSALDEAAVALDLSALRSGSGSPAPPLAVPEQSPQPVPKRRAPSRGQHDATAWVPTNLYDRLAFGNGKVRALRALFEQTHRHRSTSTPELRARSTAQPAASAAASTKLTADEQQLVMRQLREWSEHGSSDPLQAAAGGSQSTADLRTLGAGDCAHCTHDPNAARSDPSLVDVDTWQTGNAGRCRPTSPVHWRPPAANVFLVDKRALRSCAQQCACGVRRLALSVPELFARPAAAQRTTTTTDHSRLMGRNVRLCTVRQVKQRSQRRRGEATTTTVLASGGSAGCGDGDER